MASGSEFLAAAELLLGQPYTTRRPIICNDGRGVDCSGLIVCAARAVGVTGASTNSSGQARACQAAGTLLTIDEAAHTPGALLFRGPNKGYWGYGSLGHVAISVGDGTHTCEARGKAYGVVIGPITGRAWSNAGMLPGVVAGAAPAPPPTSGGKVVPQFVPPVQIVSICWFNHPTLGRCAAALGNDGGVFCDPDSAYLGGVNGSPAFKGRTPARIERPTPQEAAAGKSYVIVATSTERYHF